MTTMGTIAVKLDTSEIEKYLVSKAVDLAKRAANTFWQTFSAALIVVWSASGVDFSQITDVASAKKIGLAAVAAVVAAFLSAVKTTAAQIVSGKKAAQTAAPVVDTPETFDVDQTAPVGPQTLPLNPAPPV